MRYVLAVCLCLAFACKKPPSSDEAKDEVMKSATEPEAAEVLPKELQEPTPPVDATPIIKLVDPGQAERTKLRLNITPGSKQKLSMQLAYSAEASVGGTFPVRSPLQLVRYDITLQAQEEAPEGGIRVQLSIDHASVTTSHLAESKEQRRRLKASIKTMKALTGSYIIAPTGKITSIEFDVPSDALRLVYEMTDNLRWALLELMPSLPKEPVGEGAVWTTHRSVSLGGIHINQLSTHKLVKRDGTEVQIQTTPLQGGVAQTFKNPGTVAELELNEVRSDISNGEVTWDLTALAPHAAKINSKLVTIVQIKTPPKDGSEPMKTFIVGDRDAEVPAP